MDYKKKYYEAQEWIKSIYSELSHEQQMEAEAFFPELKESEDEKIRKWLISQLKIKSDDTNFDLNIMIDKAISWLEKQGEQKPTDEDMVEALCTEYEKGRAGVLRCIDPDVMVADFCSQTLSKTRSIASVYRQGITDIIKRINNNEKTSTTGTHSIDDGGVQLPKP